MPAAQTQRVPVGSGVFLLERPEGVLKLFRSEWQHSEDFS
jgi:hypothetical protein